MIKKILNKIKTIRIMKRLGFEYKKVPFHEEKMFLKEIGKKNGLKDILTIPLLQIESFLNGKEPNEEDIKNMIDAKIKYSKMRNIK